MKEETGFIFFGQKMNDYSFNVQGGYLMHKHIRKAAVLGSGVMGSGIAAHLANIGIPVLLLDIVPNDLTKEEEKKGLAMDSPEVRSRLSRQAVKKLLKQKPAPLTSAENTSYITPGNLEDDAAKLNEADWIIEVVVENLEVKKQIFALVDEHRKPGSIVSSNTSGISVQEMAEGRSADFKAHFLGTHFFNPARYLKLLEVIPIKETDPDILKFMTAFGENVLGKRRRHSKGHTELYRKPHRNVRASRHSPRNAQWRLSGRGGRFDHRPADRQAEKRDL